MESSRVELEAGWNEETTGPQVIRTLCAFGNDFQGLNGGYVVIGVAEDKAWPFCRREGLARRKWSEPRNGSGAAAARSTRSISRSSLPRPSMAADPRRLGSRQRRPAASGAGWQRKGARNFYIRLGNETVDAERYPDLKTQLIRMTAKVPFDDRRAPQAALHDLSETKVREFLWKVGSELVNEPDARSFTAACGSRCRSTATTCRRTSHCFSSVRIPKSSFPAPGSRSCSSGTTTRRRSFRSGFSTTGRSMSRSSTAWLSSEGFSSRWIEKHEVRPRASHWFDYPSRAVREALVNAVYHRSYEDSQEPVKVYIYPNRIEIISHPGPLPGIEMKHLRRTGSFPSRAAAQSADR